MVIVYLSVNINRIKYLVIENTRKLSDINYNVIDELMKNNYIKRVDSINYLGATLDNNLNFNFVGIVENVKKGIFF